MTNSHNIVQQAEEFENHWLYDYYLNAANSEITRALLLKWYAVDAFPLLPNDENIKYSDYTFSILEKDGNNNVTIVMLSPTGVFIIIQKGFDKNTNQVELSLTSLYIGGQGNSQNTRISKENPNETLPREKSIDTQCKEFRVKRGKVHFLSDRDKELIRRRESKYTQEQLIYHKCFKPAWQWMRRQHWITKYVENCDIVRKHAALLKCTCMRLIEADKNDEKHTDGNGNYHNFSKWLTFYKRTQNEINPSSNKGE